MSALHGCTTWPCPICHRAPVVEAPFVVDVGRLVDVKVVNAAAFSGFSGSIHPDGPKFTIRCGACPATFKARIPSIPYPTARCPECGVWNRLDVVPA